MKKPLIGLTPSHNTDNHDIQMRPTYLKAVTAAGAIPVVLPLTSSEEDLKQLVDTLDGFLFTGGPDVHPFLFGEETLDHCGSVSTERDQMELALLPLVMETGKPILGICRGVQLLNIGLGGTIWQDIPSQVTSDFPLAHTQPFAYTLPSHTVTVKPGSRLAEIGGGDAFGQQYASPGRKGRGSQPHRLGLLLRPPGRGGGNAGLSVFHRRPVASGILMGEE